MKYDHVIWDFNGTLLDDIRCGIDSTDELLCRYGLPPIQTVDRYYSLFGFPIRDYYQRLGFDFTKISYEALAQEWVEIYLDKVKKAPIRTGVLPVINILKSYGVPQTVLSMTEVSMLRFQLELLGITDYFDEICGLTDIYASSKLALAADWRARHPHQRALFIGDTAHDAESAKVMKCDCVLLAGGHESEASLLTHGCRVLFSPEAILSEIF